jgi:hypothetical protein
MAALFFHLLHSPTCLPVARLRGLEDVIVVDAHARSSVRIRHAGLPSQEEVPASALEVDT